MCIRDRVTKGGRTFSFAAVVVVGDGKGTVGQGLGKAREVSEAIAKAVKDAEKNLVRVPIFNGTIPHEAHGKFDAGRVLIKPCLLYTYPSPRDRNRSRMPSSACKHKPQNIVAHLEHRHHYDNMLQDTRHQIHKHAHQFSH